MKGRVLTQGGQDAIQVVEVVSDDGREQIAIVTLEKGAFRPSITWTGGVRESIVDRGPDVVKAAHDALKERDGHMLRTIASRVRTAVTSITGAGFASTAEMSPGGRKMSFTFQHRPVDGPAQWYQVVVRRLRQEGDR
jgi:hypothetical protein